MMSKTDQRIFEEFSKRIRRSYPKARIWAFGSRARGDATWESDFDICIVLDRIDSKKDQLIRETAWKVGFENGCVITTVVFDKKEFEIGPMSESTLVSNILQRGVSA